MNTYWGLDKPQALPPNFVVTGPISKPIENLLDQLKIKDLELSDWLDEAHAQNKDVIYVSIGTECTW